MTRRRAVVVGSGPNGLAAAVELARHGWSVVVFEAEATIGGGARTQALTLPGFRHDVCSAVHPMAVATRYLPSLPLERFGLEWIYPPLALAHPLDDGTAAVVHPSLERTAAGLGADGAGYQALLQPLVEQWAAIEADALGPPRWPRRPGTWLQFALVAQRSAAGLGRAAFRTGAARALWAGLAAHAARPLEAPASAAIGLVLAAAAHRAGWPIARGGSQAISDALAAYLGSLGGEIVTGRRIASLGELPAADAVLLDVTPAALARLGADRLPRAFRGRLERFRPGPGVFKMDWALRGPIPWRAAACADAGTVHLGGAWEEIALSERQACAPRAARPPARPFVLLSQPSRFDPGRAPAEMHTAWAYCHVPNGCAEDMSARIESQIERFAPGFGALVLARSLRPPAEMERHNPNLVGGDITGGANSLRQMLLRPTWRAYRTPAAGVYLCSASTPPGGGVHGLCGYHAARCVLASNPT